MRISLSLFGQWPYLKNSDKELEIFSASSNIHDTFVTSMNKSNSLSTILFDGGLFHLFRKLKHKIVIITDCNLSCDEYETIKQFEDEVDDFILIDDLDVLKLKLKTIRDENVFVCNIISNLVSPLESANEELSINHEVVNSILVQKIANVAANRIVNEICTSFLDSYSVCLSYHSVEFSEKQWIDSNKAFALLPDGVITDLTSANTSDLLLATLDKLDIDMANTDLSIPYATNCAIVMIKDENPITIESHILHDNIRYLLNYNSTELSSENFENDWPEDCCIVSANSSNLLLSDWKYSQVSKQIFNIFTDHFKAFMLRNKVLMQMIPPTVTLDLNLIVEDLQANDTNHDEEEKVDINYVENIPENGVEEDVSNNNMMSSFHDDITEKLSISPLSEMQAISEKEKKELIVITNSVAKSEAKISSTVEQSSEDDLSRLDSKNRKENDLEDVQNDATTSSSIEKNENEKKINAEILKQQTIEKNKPRANDPFLLDVNLIPQLNVTPISTPKSTKSTQNARAFSSNSSTILSRTSSPRPSINPEFLWKETIKNSIVKKYNNLDVDSESLENVLSRIRYDRPYALIISEVVIYCIEGAFTPNTLSTMTYSGIVNIPLVENGIVKIASENGNTKIGKIKIDYDSCIFLDNIVIYKEKEKGSTKFSRTSNIIPNTFQNTEKTQRGSVSKMNRRIELNRMMMHR